MTIADDHHARRFRPGMCSGLFRFGSPLNMPAYRAASADQRDRVSLIRAKRPDAFDALGVLSVKN
jgi:hypothetical protein